MVQPTEDGRGDDGAEVGRLRLSATGRVALQALMRTAAVVVSEELPKGATQVILTEDNQVVQALPAHRTNEPLDVRVLPRAAGRGRAVFHSYRRDALLKHPAVDGVVVPQQATRRLVEGKGFIELLSGPPRGRIGRDVEVQHARRSCERITKQYSIRNVAVGTTKKSQAAISLAWLARNVFQLGEGFPRRRAMYRATVDSATS